MILTFRLGFHAIPSMSQVHLHVISQVDDANVFAVVFCLQLIINNHSVHINMIVQCTYKRNSRIELE